MNERETFQRELRIAMLIRALYAIKDETEVQDALEHISQFNLQTLHDICAELLFKGECS
jgi:hypothetical protein